MKPLKLYARQEPTTDAIIKKYAPKANKKDTVFYKDKGATQFYARWQWDQGGRPVKRKTVVLNCYRWAIVWID